MPTLTPPEQLNGYDLHEPAPSEPSATDRRAWNEWMMVAVGLTGLISLLAIVLAIVAIGSHSTATTMMTVAAPAAAAGPATAATIPPQSLNVAIKSDAQHGRLGPDGNWHDAFLPADFTVRPGAKVTVSFVNYDSGPHSFTAPAMGVNFIIPGGGSLATPTRQTFTFTAPTKPGRYLWRCTIPCDPWAMMHDGYMRGYVTVAA